MNFNPNVYKQAQEVIFSRKIRNNIYSPLVFNNNIVSQANSQKHLPRNYLRLWINIWRASSKALKKIVKP